MPSNSGKVVSNFYFSSETGELPNICSDHSKNSLVFSPLIMNYKITIRGMHISLL